MPAKLRVSKSTSKKSGIKFRWWMAAGLVAVVAIVGIVVLRYSKASSGYSNYSYNITASALQGGQAATTNDFKGSPIVSYRTISATPSPDDRVTNTSALQVGKKYELCVYASSPTNTPTSLDVTVINNTSYGTNDAIHSDSGGLPINNPQQHVLVTGSAWQVYCGNERPLIFYSRFLVSGYASSTMIVTNSIRSAKPVNIGSIVLFER